MHALSYCGNRRLLMRAGWGKGELQLKALKNVKGFLVDTNGGGGGKKRLLGRFDLSRWGLKLNSCEEGRKKEEGKKERGESIFPAVARTRNQLLMFAFLFILQKTFFFFA